MVELGAATTSRTKMAAGLRPHNDRGRCAMIRRFLDISSAHLTPETWSWLDTALGDRDSLRDPTNSTAATLAGGPTRYGWFVYAPEEPCDGLPVDLSAALKLARQSGAEYVLFDCDAVPNMDLPVLHPDFASL